MTRRRAAERERVHGAGATGPSVTTRIVAGLPGAPGPVTVGVVDGRPGANGGR